MYVYYIDVIKIHDDLVSKGFGPMSCRSYFKNKNKLSHYRHSVIMKNSLVIVCI